LQHLVDVRMHRNMRHGTPGEQALLIETDRIKDILLNLGMSNAQIESTIQNRMHAPTTSRRDIPDIWLTRFFTPELAERTRREQELEREREQELEREREQEQVLEYNDEHAAASASRMDDESDEIDNIPVANIPKMITCPVCLEKVKDIRLNCGHLVCRECARGLKQSNGTCPVCRQPITKTEIVYYNKYLKYKAKYLALKNKN